MEIFKTKSDLVDALNTVKAKGKKIGFVPTMGALHRGHLSLVEKALEENQVVVVSIFVNPTQFDNKEDLINYPRSISDDVAILNTLGAKNIIVYTPSVEEVYNNNIQANHYNFNGLEHEMEGKFRTGHFDGVGTILTYFFELIKPDNAYFGEKDFQQLRIVQILASQLSAQVNVVGCPIYRETNGLAMSSRNERLSKELREEASFIYKTLKKAKEKFKNNSAQFVKKWVEKEFKTHPKLNLEYIEIADITSLKTVNRKSKTKKYRAFIAVFADNIRLIDNIALN